MLTLLLLAGCNPWDFPEGEGYWHETELWDPEIAVLADGVYVRLPSAGALVRVLPDGTWTKIDLDGAAPEALIPAPDGSSLLVRAAWPVCEDDDPLIVTVDDCPGSKLGTQREMVLVRDGERVNGVALDGVSPALDSAAWTSDYGIAALYLDPANTADVVVDGYLNLNEITFVGRDGTVNRVSVGFAPESVLFTSDNARAVVLARGRVAVVNLGGATDTCDPWSVCVSYPLSLDTDRAVTPTDVVLVADDQYALVSVYGSSDLYVLDLANESIDLLELAGAPSVLLEDTANDRTLVGYAGKRQIDVVEHEFFEIEEIEVEEPATGGYMTTSGALFYNDENTGYKDVIMVDGLSGDWDEQRAENPVIELVAGTRHAVATMRPESSVGNFYDSHYGLGIFTLAAPGVDVPDPVSLVLESEPVGFASIETDSADYTLLLLRDVDTLLKVRLDDAAATEIDLPASPLGIAATPDGGFVVAEDSPMGMISFVDPADDTLTTVAGFATVDFATTPVLPRRAAEE